jgi:hypothetical protein
MTTLQHRAWNLRALLCVRPATLVLGDSFTFVVHRHEEN